MKVLLVENLPHKLRTLLQPHECFTVSFMGWKGIDNGELLREAAAAGFDALISNDRGLEYEQNRQALPLSVIVMLPKDNRLKSIEAFVPALVSTLADLKPRSFVKLPPAR